MSTTHKEGASGGAPPSETQIFRYEGDYWTILYGGVVVHVRDAIGMHYLAQLLPRPQQRVGVDVLLVAVKGTTAVDVERARSTVSKRIHAAIARIGQHHEALGRHLRLSVKTGASCVYLGDPKRSLKWVT